MKIYPYFIILFSFLLTSYAMSPRSNPGCIRQNSDGIRTTLFLMHISNGQIQLASDLLDDETCANVSKESFEETLSQAKRKFAIDFNPVINRFEQLKKQKLNESPIPDLPD
jgi:hypothetical protein